MTTTRDRAVTAALVAVLAVAVGVLAQPAGTVPVIGGPSSAPTATPAPPRTYREGVVGVPTSITPITARTRSEHALVGLIFSGLVKLGPGSTFLPDLAASWTQNATGTLWTVKIRSDAAWQDGEPVTADDVVFTVAALKDPAASGATAASWAEVTATAIDAKTVQFTLATPVAGFLAALTQPLLPAHLLDSIPMASLATSDFALNPVGSGPYQLTMIDATHAVLEPTSATTAPGGAPAPSGSSMGSPAGSAGASAAATDSASPAATPYPTSSGPTSPAPSPSGSGSASASSSPSGSLAPVPTASPTAVPMTTAAPGSAPIDAIEIDFYPTEAALAAAFTAGALDAADGLSGATATTLGALPGADVLRYPMTTLSAVVLNLRATHPELRDANLRKALLGAIDRSLIVSGVLGGSGVVADALVPPGSWVYDAAAAGSVPFGPAAAATALKKLGWTQIGGLWAAPKSKSAYKVEILTVPADANPRLAAIGTAVGDAWRTLGFDVTVTRLAATDLTVRLRAGDFTAAVLDISLGLEPDLYPLLASTQVRTTGSNVAGYQDPGLDTLLEAARAPGTTDARKAAWTALLQGLAARVPILPIAWAQDLVAVRNVSGVTPRLIVHNGDRFWDVLAWRLAANG